MASQPRASETVRLRGPALYGIEDAALLLGGLGHSKVRELIRNGELGSVKIGRRRLVPAPCIADYAARLMDEMVEAGNAR
jgi:excisionase family DNA binding protein